MFLELQDMQGSKVLGDETAAMYERAITGIMKHSMLLYFAYADFEEVKKKVTWQYDFWKNHNKSLNEFLQGTYFKFQQRERSLIDRWVLCKEGC